MDHAQELKVVLAALTLISNNINSIGETKVINSQCLHKQTKRGLVTLLTAFKNEISSMTKFNAEDVLFEETCISFNLITRNSDRHKKLRAEIMLDYKSGKLPVPMVNATGQLIYENSNNIR